MSERPPERYKPGELDKTRENLGRLTPEEAKKMSRILGGEVGVEKSGAEIEEGYRKLKELNRRRNDAAAAPYRIEREKAEVSPSPRRAAVRNTPPEQANPGYIASVRMAFLASRPEHRLLRRRDAWLLLLFPFLHRRLYLNPAFLKAGDRIFYDHIERFVLSVRSLLARNRQYGLYRIKPGYLRSILYVYRNWNIENIHLELSRLQTKPREASIQAASYLFRELYRPFMLLSDLERDIETEKALKHLFDLTLLSVPKEGKEERIIKELYVTARDEIYYITSRIPRQCWPLLSYMTGTGYSGDCPSFFDGRKEDLLAFLGLEEKDLVHPPEIAPETSREEPAEETETEETEDYAALQEAAGNNGLTILARLFPDSGWDCAESWPDMVPYFKPICTLPKGSDILSPRDPVHQAVVVTAAAAELCSGFRGMRFRKSVDEAPVSETLERLSGAWHSILDEVIAKYYITPLTEYCRQYERDSDFSGGRYAEKIQSELYWIKRNYLTPYSHTRAFKGARPAIRKRLPKLFETAADMTGLLSQIILAAEESGGGLLENPDDPFHFEVPGYIPLRVKAVLQRQGKAVSNLELIKIIHGITGTLDYLLNNSESWFYRGEEEVLFRGDYLNDSAPIYAVDALDTAALIRSSDDRDRQPEKPAAAVSFGGYKEALAFISTHGKDAPAGVVFRMKRSPEPGESGMLAGFILRQVRDWIDRVFILKDGLVLLVLPDTRPEDACSLAFRLTDGIREHSESLFSPAAGVVSLGPGSSVRETLQTGVAAAGKALSAGTGAVVLYHPEEHRFETISTPFESPENIVE